MGKFGDIACSIISCIVMGIGGFMPKTHMVFNKVSPFGAGGFVFISHCVVT